MKRILLFVVIFTLVLTLYYPALFTYFSQDDFLHFKVSQTDGSLVGFINLFGFHPFDERGIAFYRPIFREALYNIFYSIFGLNHLPFRLLQFAIQFINIYLVYILMQKFFQKTTLSFFVSLFFALTASNVAVFYYLANGIQILGATMFILSTLILFIKYLKTQRSKFRLLSFLTFLLSLGSHELATVTPILLVGLTFIFYSMKKASKEISKLMPFFIILVLYLYLDITKIGFPSSEQQYQPILNLKILLNSLFWYWAWALGLPEMLIDFVQPGLRLNPTLMRYWGNYFTTIFATFAIALTILGMITIYSLLRKRAIFYNKKFWFLLIWFPLGILPVLLLPFHKSTYYLTPVLPAFWGALGFLIFSFYTNLKNIHSKVALSIILLLSFNLFVLSTTSIRLGETTHWAAQRGKIAKKLIKQVRLEYPTLPKGAVIYFTNDPSYPYLTREWGGTSKQASLILNGSDALQLLYKDSTLEVFYQDLGGIPANLPADKIYSITAKVN